MAAPLMSLPDQTLGKVKYVVPWKSRKEFLQTYHDIFSEDENVQLNAIHRIRTWKSRAGSKLSVAVETTGSLLESIINHNVALREQQVHVQESFLRSCYSLTVVRFVNHVTEKGQTKATAQPIHSLAREYGIPEWIVRIRHDATHNTLPSLDMLATAATWALQYLKEEFWNNQTHDSAGDKRCCLSPTLALLSRKIRETLQSFYKLRFKEMRSKETDQNTTADEIQQLKEFLKENRTCFVKSLLEDGALISTLEQLTDLGLCQEDTMDQLSPCLPDKLREFWQPVITMVNNNRTIYALAKVAMFSISDDECLRNYLLAGWLSFFLSNNWDSGTAKQSRQRKGLKKGIVSYETCLPRTLLLSACLDKINKFTIHLLKYLVDREELGEEANQKLSNLLNISPPSGNISCEDSLDEEEETEEENVYTVEDVVDWSQVPFGVVPSLSEEDNNEGDVGVEEYNTSREKDNSEDSVDDNSFDGNGEDDNGGGNGHTREWKRSQRKRPLEDKNEDFKEKRSPSKRCTYVVNDNELL